MVILIAVMIPILSFAPVMVKLFNSYSEVVRYGSLFLRLCPFYVLCQCEPDLSQYLAGTGGFQSPDDHYAGFVRSVPADLTDDRVVSDFIGDPGG